MVAPGMLQNDSVKRWLNGIVPAWTLLEPASLMSLDRPPSAPAAAIALARDLAREESALSDVVHNALILLQSAAVKPGLKLTATGNLSRNIIATMFDVFTWPGLDKKLLLDVHKVMNEPDFLPLFFVRHLLEAARLMRAEKGHLVITAAGRRALDEPGLFSLQAELFETAFWKTDLSAFTRGFLHGWPQSHAGVVLWSLSVAATDWMKPAELARLCTIPVNGILDQPYDRSQYALEGVMLRPLAAFGVLEHRKEPIQGQSFGHENNYRKGPLFDRFLRFDVRLEANGGVRH